MVVNQDRILHRVQQAITKAGSTDPFVIAKQFGISIFYFSLGHDVFGYYSYQHGVPIIVISSDISQVQQQFTCCHELGHFFCGHHGSSN